MPDPDLARNAHLVAFFLAPGVIALFIRSRFVPGHALSQPVLSYLVLSLAYHALALPFAHLLGLPEPPAPSNALAWILFVFIGPAALGFALALEIRTGFLRRLLRPVGLQPTHAIPTAWDWKFNSMQPHWILATFRDGTKIRGYCGRQSFISSDPVERDIYVEQVYQFDDNGKWIRASKKGMLIMPGEISTIEFWPCSSEEDADAQ